MKVIVCGAGEVGYNIAQHLSAEEIDVTLIDTSLERIEKAAASSDIQTLVGYAPHPNVLEQGGATDAEMLIAVTENDETNIITCEIASILFNITTTIARVRGDAYLRPEWSKLFEEEGLRLENIISPDEEVTSSLARLVAVPGAHDLISFADDKVRLIGIRLDSECPVLHTPLEQLTELFPDLNTRVVLIVRGDNLFVPDKLAQMKAGDDVYLIADSSKTNRVLTIFGKKIREARRIIIIGGGRIGLGVANLLEDSEPNANITLVENIKKVAEDASRKLKRTMVLHGDGIDRDILEEAGVQNADMLIAVTENDEINTLVCMLSKRSGTLSSVALLNRTGYQSIIGSLGIDAAVSPRELTVSRILRHVRRGHVLAVQSLRDGKAEIIEIVAEETAQVVGKPLSEINLPIGVAIGAVVREEKVILPRGNTIIHEGDRVIVFAFRDSVRKLEDLFAVDIGFF